ncbi:Trp biosynthesis-associated membrane protein [Dactylosporangium sp. CA-052675]|uniref:Trp biosynthesis-associated membrane protein n=1 Tax=Dactylosporangium sp. CA-052675 TaxID=3239927 RepID=UPI003D91EB25
MNLSGRRGLATTAVACAVAAAVVLFAATRSWQTAVTVQPAPLPPLKVDRTGTEISPWLTALAVVGLAGAGALLATRAAARLAVGVLLVVAGAGVVVASLVTLDEHVRVAWPLVCALGGLVVLAAGVVTVRSGRSWPGMGARYERTSAPARRQHAQTDMWDALDRGEDPTRGDRPE